jgi:tRNA(Arg) A34 adenosine deaminase TadA
MDGKKLEEILDQLFEFAKETMDKQAIYPYVSFVVKDNVIVSRGSNIEREIKDVTLQGDVVAIRNAQKALETGDLSGYILVSFFEPTILGFDVALWSGIKDFVWCINSSSLPTHYNKIKYNPLDYKKNHPKEITINNGLREKEALKLVSEAKDKKYYPDNLY